MLSKMDLEKLIAVKRLEIEKEKILLGLSSPETSGNAENGKPLEHPKPARCVSFPPADLHENNAAAAQKQEENDHAQELHGEIPPALDRYIRRYLGLPIMLKAGEFSPNNPLLAREFTQGDALLGLGEYERRRRALRPLRQRQYKEYLDQQAKKKQEAKEQAERERREREQKEREREERERERELQERERLDRERRIRVERRSPERRRASENYVGSVGTFSYSNKVDTGVQVDSVTSPLSVAVQTDDAEFFRLPSPCKSQLTQAERELSPHTVRPTERPEAAWYDWRTERRRSYGDFDERSVSLDKKALAKRNAYMPSIFDADAVHQRNLQAEKEAAARRQFYQQELKNQIMEQQRIREERKTREKMLEQAEMRRLEEQLRMLRVAQEREIDKQHHIDNTIKEDHADYEKRRKQFQKEIDEEQLKLVHAPTLASQLTSLPKPITSRSDSNKLPYYNYPRVDRELERQIRPLDKDIHSRRSERIESDIFENRTEKSRFTDDLSERNEQGPFENRIEKFTDRSEKKPYSMNIPDDSIFSPNYDVDSYLRKNLNFKDRYEFNRDFDFDNIGKDVEKNIEKVLVHERPKPRPKPIAKERNNIQQESMDSLPIPVLRHSPLSQVDRVETGSNLSDAMKKVDDKWKVPAVQKNILKSIPNEEGKNVSILTQLGSIRRQLQLEQLKLDRISKDDEV